jgi:hypothetical protein
MCHGFVGRVNQYKQVDIVGANGFAFAEHLVFYPVDKAFPKLSADKYNGEFANFAGLNKGYGFEKFVECAKAAGHHHEGLCVLYEHEFAYKKVVEIDQPVAALRCGGRDILVSTIRRRTLLSGTVSDVSL